MSGCISNNIYTLSIKIPTIVESCPECIQKGVSNDGKYYYLLRFEVSLLSLLKQIDALKSRMICLFIIILLVAILLSKIISSKLVNRIEKITAAANEIITHKNLSLNVSIRGNDEITHLASTFNSMINSLKESQDILIETEKIRSIANLSIQLAHDIRSPLAIMEAMIQKSNKNKNEVVILKEAIQSVRDIANNLLTNYRNSDSLNDSEKKMLLVHSLENINISRPIQLSSLIESLISHKRQEWSKHSCDLSYVIKSPHLKFLWINVVPNEIKRTLSNILNNSYEALHHIRKIILTLDTFDENFLQLKILDKGHGIPPDKINDVLMGMSLRHGGRGLGLSSAKQQMEKIGGSLVLNSIYNHETEVILRFPIMTTPIWLPDSIKLLKKSHVIILDDDVNVHNIWRHRLQPYDVNLLHFSSCTEMLKWHEENITFLEYAIYLMDYELHDAHFHGLKLLEKLNANKRGYLITSYADEIVIQQYCEKINVWLLPKNLMSEIPLTYSGR